MVQGFYASVAKRVADTEFNKQPNERMTEILNYIAGQTGGISNIVDSWPLYLYRALIPAGMMTDRQFHRFADEKAFRHAISEPLQKIVGDSVLQASCKEFGTHPNALGIQRVVMRFPEQRVSALSDEARRHLSVKAGRYLPSFIPEMVLAKVIPGKEDSISQCIDDLIASKVHIPVTYEFGAPTVSLRTIE